MDILDIFGNDAFSVFELTDAINVIPNKYGLLDRMNLFPVKGVSTTNVVVELKNGVLTILPQGKRGGESVLNKSGKKTLRSFVIPHFPLDDSLLADDLQNARPFGKRDKIEAVQILVNEKLEDMQAKHKITLEYLRVTALAGIIKDGVGSTILNLFTDFGVSQKEVDFVLGTTDTNIESKCKEVTRHIKKKLMGDICTRIVGLCSPAFFDKLVNHANVRDAYKFQQGKNVLRDDLGEEGFDYQGITFREYNGEGTDVNGDSQPFIADGDVRFFPEGTANTFRTYVAPADFIETVNTKGQLFYAKQERMKYGKGISIHTQSNPLPMCTRPEVLVRGHSSN